MLKEFKKFVLRGNVVDLAVAVVIGSAFTAVVSAFVKDFLTPLIASIQGKHEFASYNVSLHGIKIPYGDFLSIFITFLLTAAVVFFFVVQPLNRLTELSNRTKKTSSPTTYKCPECISEIPIIATRCMFCTTKLTAPAEDKK